MGLAHPVLSLDCAEQGLDLGDMQQADVFAADSSRRAPPSGEAQQARPITDARAGCES